ncbi:LPS export ABC transporter permease LptF [Poseidonocella sedimentorum]|uniref:Lipopolysaccharide export system permease protein n=1 Tax=Poseidonocella sedimentorum TaxID=871652 RepID=A0A1I6DZB9_9RHOB|nr:LPS export ABC transporter permease LptF [Poseidonocella sedimentorum]SFR10776.1 lipopolysaccharide export system permease protein [Poseidonocella sedimentorum]
MSRTDKYLLSQLLVLFGFFALVLVAIYWINRAVKLFDQLIGDGQSAAVFIEFSLLSVPAVIAQILPLAAFAATVYVINRLSSESELTILQATGSSPARLARPVVAFGLLVALMMSSLTHFLVPLSAARLAEREAEIAQNITAKLLTEGTFLHPARGITFYIREITPESILRDVFLSDRRDPDQNVIYSATEAYLVKADGGSKLVMVEGIAQRLDRDGLRLSTTNFEDLTYDISGLMGDAAPARLRFDYLTTPQLLQDPASAVTLARSTEGRFSETLHTRFHQPALCLVAALIGFATLMAGGFTRFGLGVWIVLSIFFLIVVMMVQSAVTDPVRENAALWPLTYLPALCGLGIALTLLGIAQSGGIHRRARAAALPAAPAETRA